MTQAAHKYKQMQVMTSNRGDILIMLYEAAIRHVKKASESIANNDLSQKGAAIGKAHDIINELLNTLNFEIGGKIAEDLEQLYSYMIDLLLKANLENSTEKLGIVQKLLENLLEGWRGAVEKVKQGKVGPDAK